MVEKAWERKALALQAGDLGEQIANHVAGRYMRRLLLMLFYIIFCVPVIVDELAEVELFVRRQNGATALADVPG